MILVFIGPPGSGKGTQASLLTPEFKVISVGDLLRTIIEHNGEGAEVIKDFINSGKLVPIDIINQLMQNYLKSLDISQNVILDGYPRNIEQALFLEKNCINNFKVLFFDISNNVLLQRLKGRFICSNCKKVYNHHYYVPKVLGICDICSGNKFENRADDQIDVIQNRLNLYRLETAPLIDFYKKNNKVSFINSNQPIDKVFEDVKKVLRSY